LIHGRCLPYLFGQRYLERTVSLLFHQFALCYPGCSR
jgi:hypothetical protein